MHDIEEQQPDPDVMRIKKLLSLIAMVELQEN
jgi:hypothetical protein